MKLPQTLRSFIYRSAAAVAFVCAATAALAAADEPIACSGTWAATMSEEALVKQFGRANVVRGAVYVAEGNEEQGTILFPKNEKKRIEIVWKDKRRRRPDWIRVPEGSRWPSFAGIANGMTVQQVEKLNGRTFKLSGFDWDYGGFVTDWRGGQLATTTGKCHLQVRFDRAVPEEPTRAQQKALDATSGDRELLSSAANLRLFPTRVSQIVISFPD